MKLGIATLIFADFDRRGQPRDLYRALEKLAGLGFKYIEYNDQSIPQPFALSEAELAKVAKAVDRLGLIIQSIHIPCTQLPEGDIGSLDSELRSRCMDIARRTLETCKRLKAKYAVIHPGGAKENLKDEKIRQQVNAVYLDSLRQLCDFIGQDDLAIVIENGGSPFSSIEGIQETIRTIGSPRLQICIDTGHALGVGSDPAAMIRKAGKRLHHLHIHDTVVGQDAHLIPGEGAIDWGQVLQALRSIPYPDVFMLEVAFSKQSQDPDVVARTVKQVAERLLKS